jgi:hypothetical protein
MVPVFDQESVDKLVKFPKSWCFSNQLEWSTVFPHYSQLTTTFGIDNPTRYLYVVTPLINHGGAEFRALEICHSE